MLTKHRLSKANQALVTPEVSAPDKASVPATLASLNDIAGQKLVPGSARFWAAHFSPGPVRAATTAVLCFAQLMDELCTVSADVVREKSVWWHEELQRFAQREPRHPLLNALLQLDQLSLGDKLHEQLHGALMTQQRIVLDTQSAQSEYARLRIGSLHELLSHVAGVSINSENTYSQWAADMALLAVTRAPGLYSDTRWLPPGNMANNALPEDDIKKRFESLLAARQQVGSIASEILLHHDIRWWRSPAVTSSPSYSHAPLGIRGMLHSWQVARTHHRRKLKAL